MLSDSKTATGTVTFALTDSPTLSMDMNFVVKGTEHTTYLGVTQEAKISNTSNVLKVNLTKEQTVTITMTISYDDNILIVPESITTAQNKTLSKISNENGVAIYKTADGVSISSGDYLVLDNLLSAIYPTVDATNKNYSIKIESQAGNSVPASAILSGKYDCEIKKEYTITFELSGNLIYVQYADGRTINSGDIIPEGALIEFKISSSRIVPYNEDGTSIYLTPISGSLCGSGAIYQFTMPTQNVTFKKGGGGSCCVYEDTLIILADGSTKRADEIELGDRIKSYNFETGKIEVDTIIQIININRTELITINFKDGTSIKLTNDHPLYTELGWKCYDKEKGEMSYTDLGIVGDFEVGDKLFSLSKYFDKEVVSIEYEEDKTNGYNTYQFGVEKNSNYFANGVLSSAL